MSGSAVVSWSGTGRAGGIGKEAWKGGAPKVGCGATYGVGREDGRTGGAGAALGVRGSSGECATDPPNFGAVGSTGAAGLGRGVGDGRRDADAADCAPRSPGRTLAGRAGGP
jgi:hypothetical protein